jgi:hypothetical protein
MVFRSVIPSWLITSHAKIGLQSLHKFCIADQLVQCHDDAMLKQAQSWMCEKVESCGWPVEEIGRDPVVIWMKIHVVRYSIQSKEAFPTLFASGSEECTVMFQIPCCVQ